MKGGFPVRRGGRLMLIEVCSYWAIGTIALCCGRYGVLSGYIKIDGWVSLGILEGDR